jgi:hypothetical protein
MFLFLVLNFYHHLHVFSPLPSPPPLPPLYQIVLLILSFVLLYEISYFKTQIFLFLVLNFYPHLHVLPPISSAPPLPPLYQIVLLILSFVLLYEIPNFKSHNFSFSSFYTWLRKMKKKSRTIIRSVFKIVKTTITSSHLCVRPHGTTRLPVDGFSWNILNISIFCETLDGFSSNFWHTSIFIKIGTDLHEMFDTRL